MDGLLTSLGQHLGRDYAEQIAVNYVAAVQREDWSGVRDYDRVLLGKVVADKTEVTQVDSEDQIAARTAAFQAALTALAATQTRK
jgi:hypothetical protein